MVPKCWTLQARQILLVPAGSVVDFLAHPKVRSPFQAKSPAVVATPTRPKLASLVGWMCKYTPYLLYGPPKLTEAAWFFRRSRHLATRYGICSAVTDAKRREQGLGDAADDAT